MFFPCFMKLNGLKKLGQSYSGNTLVSLFYLNQNNILCNFIVFLQVCFRIFFQPGKDGSRSLKHVTYMMK